jgi:hypothetical protein
MFRQCVLTGIDKIRRLSGPVIAHKIDCIYEIIESGVRLIERESNNLLLRELIALLLAYQYMEHKFRRP